MPFLILTNEILEQVLENQCGCIFPLKKGDLIFFRSCRTAVFRKIKYLKQLVKKKLFKVVLSVASALTNLSHYSLETYKLLPFLYPLLLPLVISGKNLQIFYS